jgi:hypothetical protein
MSLPCPVISILLTCQQGPGIPFLNTVESLMLIHSPKYNPSLYAYQYRHNDCIHYGDFDVQIFRYTRMTDPWGTEQFIPTLSYLFLLLLRLRLSPCPPHLSKAMVEAKCLEIRVKYSETISKKSSSSSSPTSSVCLRLCNSSQLPRASACSRARRCSSCVRSVTTPRQRDATSELRSGGTSALSRPSVYPSSLLLLEIEPRGVWVEEVGSKRTGESEPRNDVKFGPR